MNARNLSLWISLGAAAFVLAVAIYVRNPGLFIMVPLCLAAAFAAWRKKT